MLPIIKSAKQGDRKSLLLVEADRVSVALNKMTKVVEQEVSRLREQEVREQLEKASQRTTEALASLVDAAKHAIVSEESKAVPQSNIGGSSLDHTLDNMLTLQGAVKRTTTALESLVEVTKGLKPEQKEQPNKFSETKKFWEEKIKSSPSNRGGHTPN